MLACPVCRRLVHSDDLKRLAADAEEATREGRLRDALVAWREALALLPPGSTQHEQVRRTVDDLGQRAETAPSAGGARALGRLGAAGAGLAGLALLVWKLKFLLGVVATKGKLLLLGLGKSGTSFSMLLSFGVYWTAWGWVFALGIVLSLYVHEMGHVAALHRLGIKASAPMFVPGLGAYVRMREYPASPREDARVGLAGPVWGLGAALATWAAHLATGEPALAAIARVAAWINLANLLPLWQLDGGRGFRALARGGRWAIAAVVGAAWLATGEGLLVLLLLVAVVRAAGAGAPEAGDRRALATFAVLVVALAALSAVPVPGLG